MGQIFVILLLVAVLFFICYLWVSGIDYMHKNHPDYTGDDLFGFEENKKENNEK